MAKYETHFIPENIAPKGSDYIEVYNGEKLEGKVNIGKLKMPNLGNKLYSFGALSDVHVTHKYSNGITAMAKFQKAVTYFNDVEKVKFICISGDLVGECSAEQFSQYTSAVNAYGKSNIPIYGCLGNHDVDKSPAPFLTKESTQQYIGQDLYYSFEQGDDLFIMFSMSGWPNKTGAIFTNEQLQWLYGELEANRNRRCFVFEHCPSMVYSYDASTQLATMIKNDGSGKVYNSTTSGSVLGWRLPTGHLLNQDKAGQTFRALMAHYHNVVWVHGHSHMEFHYQADCSQVNYDKNFGCHSIHVPSCAEGRKLNEAETGYIFTPRESYGYVIDVYENNIVLRGRDFIADKFSSIATYCIDTTLQTIPAKTFVDPSGIIDITK